MPQLRTSSCKVSHSISIAKANKTVIEALQYAVDHLNFNILPAEEKHTPEDYSKPLAALRKKLARTKEAYINGVDTLEEYKENKQRITEDIAKLEKEQAANTALPEVDKEAFAAKVRGVIAVINSPDTTEQAKNEALRSVLAKSYITSLRNPLSFISMRKEGLKFPLHIRALANYI